MTDLAHRFPPESAAGRLLRLPLRIVPRGRFIRILTGPARGLRWRVGVGLHGCWLGTYERLKQDRFRQLVRPGQVVHDIGANTGFYSLLAARLVGSKGEVHSFEPNPSNVQHLREHMRANDFQQVSVHPCAVSDREGTFQFQCDGSFTGRLSDDGTHRVSTVTLDSFLRNDGVPPDLLKIDVEGAEFDVLNGGMTMLKQCRPTILLATHGEQVHRECVKLLRSLDYELTALESKDEINATDEIVAQPGHLNRI